MEMVFLLNISMDVLQTHQILFILIYKFGSYFYENGLFVQI